MSDGRRKLSIEDYDDLETDESGALFWRGKRIQTGGLSTGEKIALVGVIAVILGGLATLVAGYPNLRLMWEDLYQEEVSSAFNPPTSR